MDLAIYSKVAFTEFAIYPEAGDDIVYPLLGLVGEVSEVNDKLLSYNGCSAFDPEAQPLLRELGDVLWYCNAFIRSIELDFVKMVPRSEGWDNFPGDNLVQRMNSGGNFLVHAAGHIAEQVKKMIRGREPFGGERGQDCANHLSAILGCIAVMAEMLDSSLEEIAEMNYTKLSERKQKDMIHGDGDNRERIN